MPLNANPTSPDANPAQIRSSSLTRLLGTLQLQVRVVEHLADDLLDGSRELSRLAALHRAVLLEVHLQRARADAIAFG